MKKNILITGCSSGLGFALTNYYLEKGFKVFGISRNSPIISNHNFIHKSYDLSNISQIKEELSAFIVWFFSISKFFVKKSFGGFNIGIIILIFMFILLIYQQHLKFLSNLFLICI